jgi:hypothetical protein
MCIGGGTGWAYLNGWLDELRFSKNIARYVGGSDGATYFTPETTAYAPYGVDSQSKYGPIYDYTYAPFLTTAAGAQDWGDKWLYRSQGLMRAVSLTIPFNLFLEPNYTIRYVTKTSDILYEVTSVMHRGSESACYTTLEAGTTLA